MRDKDYKEMENAVVEISKPVHQSVLSDEVVGHLITRPEGVYVDATLGMGGHTKSILDYTHSRCLVIGLDVDEEAIRVGSGFFAYLAYEYLKRPRGR